LGISLNDAFDIFADATVYAIRFTAYLGRELARAENALKTGENYVQDRASGCGCHQNESCY